MLRVSAVTADGRFDLLVDNDVYFDPSFGPPLQYLIESPFLVEVRRSPQKDFWTQPPIGNVNGLLCFLQSHRDGIEIVSAVDIPLDLVTFPLGRKRLEAVALRDGGTLPVGSLLVLFIVAMVWVYDVAEFADFTLEVARGGFDIVEVST